MMKTPKRGKIPLFFPSSMKRVEPPHSDGAEMVAGIREIPAHRQA
jgi:hypothetical protein